jgi:hypothetical protein
LEHVFELATKTKRDDLEEFYKKRFSAEVDGINKCLCSHFIIMRYYREYILTLSVIVITESIVSSPLGLCRRKYEIDFSYNLGIEKSWIGDQDNLF